MPLLRVFTGKRLSLVISENTNNGKNPHDRSLYVNYSSDARRSFARYEVFTKSISN